MKRIRLLSLLLALVMTLALLTSCKPSTDDPAQDPANSTTEETELKLVTQGKTDYVIVYDYKAGSDVIEACTNMSNIIHDVIGATIKLKQCYSDRDLAEDVVADHEILVGSTNRVESIEAMNTLRSQDYMVGLYGSKLVIGSGSDAGTVSAITEFLTQFVYEQGNRAGVREGNKYDLVFKSSDTFISTGMYSYSVCEMLGARIDSYVLIYPKMDTTGNSRRLAENLRSYISMEAGYELKIYKDSRCYGDYEILIGDTARSDKTVTLADNEYYIRLTAKKNDNGEIIGGTLEILFGSAAQSLAYNAFRRDVLPASREVIELHLEDGLVWTNVK